jgi:hypothetical protein
MYIHKYIHNELYNSTVLNLDQIIVIENYVLQWLLVYGIVPYWICCTCIL